MKKEKNRKNSKIIGKIFIILIGIGFIYVGIRGMTLSILGEEAIAIYTTSIIGGEQETYESDSRYRWSVQYTFEVDEKEYTGSEIVRGSSYDVKLPKKITYFKLNPNINAIYGSESENIVLPIIIGIVLILVNTVNFNKKWEN